MFSKRLLELLKEKRITKKKFSEDLDIGINTVKRWETTGTIPGRGLLASIASYLSVSVAYLLGESDEKQIDTGKKDDDQTQAVKVALFGGEEEVTDEMWEEVQEFAKFVMQKHKNKKQ